MTTQFPKDSIIDDLKSLVKEPDETVTENYIVDFLNSRFTELEDLENINSILDVLNDEHQVLNEKFIQIHSETSETLKYSLSSFNATVTELENLQSTRLELGDWLASQFEIFDNGHFGSKKKDDLLDELIKLQRQVYGLGKSKKYMKILVIADELSNQAKQLVEKSPQKALVPYTQLMQLAHKIKYKNEQVGYSIKNLDAFLQQSVDALWDDMKSRLSKKFQQTLDSLNWPTPINLLSDNSITSDNLSAFTNAFTDLLILQQPIESMTDSKYLEPGSSSSKENSNSNNNSKAEGPPPLIPIQIMVDPLKVKFNFHFNSRRATNRIDKPEWYFTYILTAIREHSPFLQEVVQPILDKANFQKYHAKFICSLLVVVTNKLTLSMPTLLNSPQVFSHTVFETLQLDQTLRELHMYVPPGKKEWKGCVDVFTGKKEWFKAWLKVEKSFAEARYDEIMHSEDAWEIEDEDGAEDEFKPTKSAKKLMNLLELVTSRYKLLPLFHNRIRFLVDIQAELLISYAHRIDSAVDAFENLGYSFVRAVPNTSSTEGKFTSSIEGLKRLCRWLNSAGYVSRTIKEWGEDAFFLELWHEVTVRAARDTGTSPLSSPTFPDGITDKSSANKVEVQITVDEGTVFDDPAGLFDHSFERIQAIIVKNVSKEFLNGLKVYSKNSNNNSNTVLLELSPDLYAPLSDLAQSFNFLSNNLPTRIFKLIFKEVSEELQGYIWDRILMRNQFSEMGGFQFKADMEKGLFFIGKRWVKKPENYFKRIKEACILLTLPSKKNIKPTVNHDNNDEDKRSKQNSLSYVTSILYNEEVEPIEITRMLENLGIHHLSAKEAKDIVERRIECWK
ncbi:5599_t:CDS:10 [Entrophospora sp. SA101]|nr:5599_t:CDS:10 [Entrophospora sp. SA101]CAJ0830787.1 5443_t:CDS:10 [Entrophospora sp. SA101]